MPMRGGMIFDARPYQPSAQERAHGMQRHPLGDAKSRPPWLPSPDDGVTHTGVLPVPNTHVAPGMPAGGSRRRPAEPGEYAPLPEPRGQAKAPPPPPPPPQSAPVGPSMRVETPSMEDLFSLYKLCGGNTERCIELLARLWDADAERIAPVVRGWLIRLPEVPVPSRISSAPATLPSELSSKLRSFAGVAAGTGPIRQQGAGAPSVGPLLLGGKKPPPVSAPAHPGLQPSRSFDMRALQQAVVRGSAKLGRQTLTLPSVPENRQQILWTQGHAPGEAVEPQGEDALAAFMYQARVNEKLVLAGLGGNRPGMTRHMR
jgi:hypothetical protein